MLFACLPENVDVEKDIFTDEDVDDKSCRPSPTCTHCWAECCECRENVPMRARCGGRAVSSCGKGSIVSVMYSSGQGLDRCLCTLAASLPLHSSPLFSRPDGFQGGLSALSRLRFYIAQIVPSLSSLDIFWDCSAILTVWLYLTETDSSCQILTFSELWGRTTNRVTREQRTAVLD